VTRWDA